MANSAKVFGIIFGLAISIVSIVVIAYFLFTFREQGCFGCSFFVLPAEFGIFLGPLIFVTSLASFWKSSGKISEERFSLIVKRTRFLYTFIVIAVILFAFIMPMIE